MRKKRIDYTTIVSYTVLLFLFLLFNKLEQTVMPYSTAILAVAISTDCSVFISPLLYLLSFLLLGATGMLFSASISAMILVVITLIYKKLKTFPSFELCFFTLASLIAFIIVGDTSVSILMEKRILCAVFTCFLTLICKIAQKAVVNKGLKIKFAYEEYATVTLCVVLIGLGICNLFSPYVWKTVSVSLILLVCYIYKLGTGTLISAIFGCALSIYYGNINFVSVFVVYSIFAQSTMKISRKLSCALVVLSDYLIQTLFSIYQNFFPWNLVSVFFGALIIFAIPEKPLKSLKDKLYSFREKQLVRSSINQNRTLVSNRLYELSGVFSEMAGAFNSFKKTAMPEEKAKSSIISQIIQSSCVSCENYERCSLKKQVIQENVAKMIDLGFAKGKLSFIDLPKPLESICVKPNNILYGLNKLLADYRSYILDTDNLNSGREMLKEEAEGVSEILKDLAVQSGELLKYQSKLERTLSENLFKSGFMVSELLIYGEEDVSVGIVLTMKEFSVQEIQRVISKTLQKEVILTEKTSLSPDKCYLFFKKSAPFDAVFGLSKATKDNSSISGDTHSVTRIKDDKFLVALSDGMGSGKSAEEVSSSALSLIESFYKAGLKGNLILKTVNKLLSLNEEDTFSALDISVIDLKNCSVDFIKYGSPYGFIINQNGIKIVEGNSLPLGILKELKPSVCHTNLSDGDMVLLITDGVSDAFGDSSSIIDFLRSLPALNPQTLANEVIEKAIALNDGKKKDDMTALCVRVYEKPKTA